MILFGVRLLINMFDLFIYRRFLEVFIGKRKTGTEFSIIILLTLALFTSLINPKVSNLLNLLVCISAFCIYILQYQVTVKSKVIAVALYLGITFITEPIGYLIHRATISKFFHDETISFYFIALLLQLVRSIVVEIFCFLKRGKRISLSPLPKEVSYILFAIPLFSSLSCILIIEIASASVNSEIVILCMAVIFTVIMCNYLMFVMVHRYVELIDSRHEEELSKIEAGYREEYYRDMEESIEHIHNIRHDMKNQLIALYDLMEHQDGTVAKEQIKLMLKDVTETGKEKYSSNPIVNGILKIKAEEAKKHEIRMTINTFIPKKMDIEIGDYGILYGNILDNAIEACQKIPKEKRFIDFATKYQDGKLLITMTNSKPADCNVSFSTTKADKKRHGRGMKSVKKVCERYRGTFLPKDLGETFQTDMLLMEIACLE